MNQGPIIINGFSRGGTTILSNILASHPDVCYLGETHHIFKGHRHTDSKLEILRKSLIRDLPWIIRQREDVFSPRLIRARRPLGDSGLAQFRDLLLTERQNAARYAMYSKYKSEGQVYSADEIVKTRLMSKNVDGMIFTTDILAAAFPEATFVGLLRNGFALCEGHLRRGRSAAESGWRYRTLIERMQWDAERLPRYFFVRFEDLMANPVQLARDLYQMVGLDPTVVERIRMQRRRVMDSSGNHRLQDGGQEWSVEWLTWDDLPKYCQGDVNRNQIARLSEPDRESFLQEAAATMQRLGYLELPAGRMPRRQAPNWVTAER